MSVIDPARSSVAPDVRLYTEEGQRYRERSREREDAMAGRPTVIMPDAKLPKKFMREGCRIVRVSWRVERGRGVGMGAERR